MYQLVSDLEVSVWWVYNIIFRIIVQSVLLVKFLWSIKAQSLNSHD